MQVFCADLFSGESGSGFSGMFMSVPVRGLFQNVSYSLQGFVLNRQNLFLRSLKSR